MFISLLTEEIRADILALGLETGGLLNEIVGEMFSREDAKARRCGLVDGIIGGELSREDAKTRREGARQ